MQYIEDSVALFLKNQYILFAEIFGTEKKIEKPGIIQ